MAACAKPNWKDSVVDHVRMKKLFKSSEFGKDREAKIEFAKYMSAIYAQRAVLLAEEPTPKDKLVLRIEREEAKLKKLKGELRDLA